jgi:hypothetical protein
MACRVLRSGFRVWDSRHDATREKRNYLIVAVFAPWRERFSRPVSFVGSAGALPSLRRERRVTSFFAGIDEASPSLTDV